MFRLIDLEKIVKNKNKIKKVKYMIQYNFVKKNVLNMIIPKYNRNKL